MKAMPPNRVLMLQLAYGFTGLMALTPGLVLAQEDQSDQIESLERQLESVEQSIRDGQDMLLEIRKQLAELKGANLSGSAQQQSTTAQTAAASTAQDADSGDSDSALAEVADIPRGMQGSINPLRESKNYLTGDDLLDEEFPNSFLIPGTGGRMAIRGYAKLDFIQDFDYVGDRFEFRVPSIPVEGTPEASLGGRTTLHAKESRLAFDFRKTATRNDGAQYPLQAYLEWDFFDDRETFNLQPRLRQAYGVIGRLLAGQTWTSSSDLSVLAGLIDFDGGDALYGGRVAQLRWADRFNENTTWAISLEENQSEVGNPSGFDGQNRPETPNLGGYLRWTSGRAHLGLGYDIFGISWQGEENAPSDSAIGWGVALTGRYLLGKKSRNALSTQLTYGEGSAFRVLSLSGAGAGAVLTPDGTIETLPHWSAYVAYNQYWTDSLNSSFVLAYAEADSTPLLPGTNIKSASTAHINLIYFPYKSVSTGVELMWGERENLDGATGDATRFQAMVKYKFN